MPKYYSIKNKADSKTAEILIYGIIGDSWYSESTTARQFVADLKALEKDHDRINIRINSPGGSVFDGLAIFNALKNSTAEIHTYNDAMAASMGAVLMFAAPKGNVHSADNALMMLHSPITGVYGNAGDIQQVLDMLKKVEDSLITCIVSRDDKKTADDIKAKYFDFKDHWLTADEAETEGFIDVIEKGNLKVSNKATNLTHDKVIEQFDTLVKGRSIFDRLFKDAFDFFSQSTDMDIKVLRKECGLGEDATEQDVLDFIRNAKKENEDTTDAAEGDADGAAEDDLADDSNEDGAADGDSDADDAKDQKIKDLEQQIANLKRAPGAQDKKVSKQTDGGKSADNSFGVYKSAKDTFNAVTSLMQ